MQVELSRQNEQKVIEYNALVKRNMPTFNSSITFIVNQILLANLEELIKQEKRKQK
jgi:hypothetical protein